MKRKYYVLIILIIIFIVGGWYMFGYDFQSCKNEIFTVSRKNIMDGGSTYYNLNTNQKLGTCTGIWDYGSKAEACRQTYEQAGMCKKTNVLNFLLHKWF